MLALYKKKRAVSPVIAVILLIALTVATVAIIWGVVLPILQTGTVVVTPVTTSADVNATHSVWTGTVSVSEKGTLTVAIGADGGLMELGGSLTTSGEHSVIVSWPIGDIPAGTYNVVFTFLADGAEGNTIETISVTFA